MALYVSPWRSVAVLLSLCLELLPDDEFRRLGVRGDLLARSRGAYRLLCRGAAVLQEHGYWRPVLDLRAVRRLSALSDAARNPGESHNRNRRLTRRWSAQDR